MIRWLCSVKKEQKHSTEDLRKRNHIHYIQDVLRCNRLRLSGQLYRQEKSLWAKTIMSYNVDGPTSRSRPKLRWKDVFNPDLRKKHLNISLASDMEKCHQISDTADCTPTHHKRNKEMKRPVSNILWSIGLAVKALVPVFKIKGWLKDRLSLSFLRRQ